MAPSTFVLVPGAGGRSSYWYRVAPELERAGHPVVAVDLPNWPGATLTDQADAIVTAAEAKGEKTPPVATFRLTSGWPA